MTKKRSPEAYAQAALKTVMERWQKSLGKLEEKLLQDEDLRVRLGDPSVSTADRLAEVKKLFPDFPDDVLDFVGVLMENKDLGMLGRIVDELGRLSQVEARPVLAEVTTAIPLTEEEKESLRKRLQKDFGSNLAFRFEVNPDILGGLVIRVGDKMIDNSVAGRLKMLQQSLGVAE